jgi:Family of unknown function (DUF5317)
MLLGVVFLFCLVTVPLAGGRLSALGDLRLQMPGLAFAGIVAQVLIVSVVPHGLGALADWVHLLSYALLGACAWVNRRVPGVPLIALGGLLNVIVIAANGGVMPADPSLIVHAAQAGGDGFVNSGVVHHPHLAFLGDNYATPRDWPLANVYSIGDFVILTGVVVLLHRVSGSKLFAWAGPVRLHRPAPRTAADRAAAAAARAAARSRRASREVVA